MGLVIDPSGHGEEHARGQGMGKHVQDRTRQADIVQSGHAQEHISHVAGAAVPDDVLGIARVVGHVPAVQNAADAEDGRDRHQGVRRLGQNLKIGPDDREMPELHQDSGVQHARGRGSGRVPDRRPGMQRPERRDRGKTEEAQQPDDRCQGAVEMRFFGENRDVEGMESRELVNKQNAHQGQDCSGGQEQGELHGGVFFAVAGKIEDEAWGVPQILAFRTGHFEISLGVAAPDAKQRIHGDDRHLIEEVQKDQIQRDIDADGRAGEHQQKRVKLLGPVLDVPRDEDTGEQ